MFAYCNNNPVNYCDESGSYSTYCTLVADSGGSGNYSIVGQEVYSEFCEKYYRYYNCNFEIPHTCDEVITKVSGTKSEDSITAMNEISYHIRNAVVGYLFSKAKRWMFSRPLTGAKALAEAVATSVLFDLTLGMIFSNYLTKGDYYVYCVAVETTGQAVSCSADGEPYVNKENRLSIYTYYVTKDYDNGLGVYHTSTEYLVIAP